MGQLYDKCKALYRGNYEIVMDSMGKVSGGDADGAFFIFDKPVTADIDLKEPFTRDLCEHETILGVFFSDNRICPADYIVIRRTDGISFYLMPLCSVDMHEKIKHSLLCLKEQGRLKGFRWNEHDGVKFEIVFKNAMFDLDNECMMKQWLELKEKHPGAIILFRRGDFYETYGDDAEKVARTCGITLSTWGYNPMRARAGFPHHALDMYLPKLVRAGYRLAICDPIEEPKKCVHRCITETVNG